MRPFGKNIKDLYEVAHSLPRHPTELCTPLPSSPSNMPSLFEPISKNLVKELGDKDLRPVKYLLSTSKFRQLALLWKKKGTHAQFWGQPAVPVEYTSWISWSQVLQSQVVSTRDEGGKE